MKALPGDPFPTSRGCWQDRVPQTEAFSSSLAVGWTWASVSWKKCLSTGKLTVDSRLPSEEPHRACKIRPPSLPDLILAVTSHHLQEFILSLQVQSTHQSIHTRSVEAIWEAATTPVAKYGSLLLSLNLWLSIILYHVLILSKFLFFSQVLKAQKKWCGVMIC